MSADKISSDQANPESYPAEQAVEQKLTPEMRATIDALINPEAIVTTTPAKWASTVNNAAK